MPSPSIHQAVNQPTLLPVVRRVILQLDQLYLEFSHLGDAVDRGRLAELYGQWLSAGRTGPSGLRFYAQALGAALPEGDSRVAFSVQAEGVLVHLQSGYAH